MSSRTQRHACACACAFKGSGSLRVTLVLYSVARAQKHRPKYRSELSWASCVIMGMPARASRCVSYPHKRKSLTYRRIRALRSQMLIVHHHGSRCPQVRTGNGDAFNKILETRSLTLDDSMAFCYFHGTCCAQEGSLTFSRRTDSKAGESATDGPGLGRAPPLLSGGCFAAYSTCNSASAPAIESSFRNL